MWTASLPRFHSHWRIIRRRTSSILQSMVDPLRNHWWSFLHSLPYPKQLPDESVGDYGERLAMTFLRRSGYVILEHSYACPLGEIDVIAAWKQQVVVFVEVKTWGRARVDPGRPADAVDDVKQRKLCKTPLHYAKRHGLLESRGRFDVIEIRLTDSQPNLCHIQAAFQSEERFQLHS